VEKSERAMTFVPTLELVSLFPSFLLLGRIQKTPGPVAAGSGHVPEEKDVDKVKGDVVICHGYGWGEISISI